MSNGTNPIRQTKETARKARELRRLHKSGVTWTEAARQADILKKNGEPDPGLAYRIALQGYEPKTQEVRDRLGLKKFCLYCMRGFRKEAGGARSLPPWRSWWNRLSAGERDKRIRSEYEKEQE